ncbi:nucleotide-binding universal stress UspA family protein [Pedobacter sp. CG_S7]|uniref:universal stress protein n=1 Tax=Pedobacter sp. CG_S7 TaxID=3143930 RepID=UPI003393F273
MKTILVTTDFSVPSENAAHYALGMAKRIGADLLLCNAIKIQMEAPIPFQGTMPLHDTLTQKNEVDEQLNFLAESLRADVDNVKGAYLPLIESFSQIGTLQEVVKEIEINIQLSLIVMGVYSAPSIVKIFMGSKSQKILDTTATPIILVPFSLFSPEIKRIAFATDLSHGDILRIQYLVEIAQLYNAELLIVNFEDEKAGSEELKQKTEQFINVVTKNNSYPNISFQDVKSSDLDSGLDWLSKYGSVDLMAMVHYRSKMLERIFDPSHTRNLASHINIPLLVFPGIVVPPR